MNKFLVLLILFSISLISCNDENISPANGKGTFNLSFGGSNDEIAQNYLSNFDLTNLIGSITLVKTYNNNMNRDNTPYQEFTSDGYARFYDDNGFPLELGHIGVNNTNFEDVGEQSYQTLGTSLNVNFGTGDNTITVSNNQGHTWLDTNITFDAPFMLTNFTYLQNFSKSSDRNITWTGSNNNSIVAFDITTTSAVLDADTTSFDPGVASFFLTNNGNYLMVKEFIDDLKLGKSRLTISRTELKILPLKNGKTVALVIISTYDSYVNITN